MIQETRNRRTAVIAIVTLVALIGVISHARAQHMQTTPVLDDYFKMVFAGDLSGAPRADEGADLDQLIDHAVGTDLPVVITANGQDIGLVSKPRLLRGIQGGKEE